MYFECCHCHHLVDDGSPALQLCLDCLYLDEIDERACAYYDSLADFYYSGECQFNPFYDSLVDHFFPDYKGGEFDEQKSETSITEEVGDGLPF